MNVELDGEISRALVVANPASANARRIGRQIRNIPLLVSMVETSPHIERTQEAILFNAREGDIIMSAGGDGTSNQVLNILMSDEFTEAGLHRMPFLPLRGGNANDTAYMLNGRKSPDRILREGRFCWINPLEVIVNPDEANDRRYALGYFGVGATAAASRRLDTIKGSANILTKNLGLQLVRETLHALVAVSDFEPFVLKAENIAPCLISEMLFAKGDRMAKLARTHADIFKPQMEIISEDVYGVPSTLVAMFNLAKGRLNGDMDNNYTFAVESSHGAPLPVQYDGEVKEVPSGSSLNVRVSPSPYKTISTRLPID